MRKSLLGDVRVRDARPLQDSEVNPMFPFRIRAFFVVFLLAIPATLVASEPPSERTLVKKAMVLRSDDPWPRGMGHIVYAWPGSKESDKGYEEPGGSFSPSVGSFGISFWVVNSEGHLLCSSDSIPLDKLTQHFNSARKRPLPDIVIETPYYTATWSLTREGEYALHLWPKAGVRIVTAIRSVGPAGGPINSIRVRDHRLTVNNEWSLSFSTRVRVRSIGHEGESGWTTSTNKAEGWHGKDGWGYALLTCAPGIPQKMIIRRERREEHSLAFRSVTPLKLQLPDPRFEASLNAQVAHLMMGLVRNETRPGEPTNYPLPWLRDGAYVVVALARAGQIDAAKQLARYFADHDFFGGFGPEADAPGLSLWAIGEVSALARDWTFDAAMWPSVQRKAQFIQRMRGATSPIYEEPFGPIVPIYAKSTDLKLVADAARDGLIVGRMDWGRPLLFVNAVSFAGLMQAASMANRIGQPEKAKVWTDEAHSIQMAWKRALLTSEQENERTYISALWPTYIGADSIEIFTQLLERRWDSIHSSSGGYLIRPAWTYFDIADAHQWLMLDRQDRAWQTLSWFFDHQSAPGFYTWWEGTGEENNFGRWEHVRGWIDPKCVTPHYWTAAEVLLLQLDMLAHVDTHKKSSIVVGAGIPRAWCKSDMAVRGLRTEVGVVDWYWRNSKLKVVVHHGSPRVIAGSAFGPNVRAEVTFAK